MVKVAGPGDFLQKCPLLADGLQKSYFQTWAEDLERQAREPCSTTYVEKLPFQFDPSGEEQTFTKMARNTFRVIRGADQIDLCIPPDQKPQVSQKAVRLIGTEVKPKGLKDLGGF